MRLVLCYHKVGHESVEGRWINVSPDTLRKHIEFFKRRGFHVLPASDIFSSTLKNAISITFDDAFQSMLENGLPVLKSLSVPGTIYAVSSYVGSGADWPGNNGEPLANWDLLREAEKEGMEIGNHTATHASLRDLDKEAQVAEISRCHQQLIANGLAPKTFCLPYGHYNSNTSKAVQEAGYDVGFTVEKRWLNHNDDPRLLPRFAMSYGDGLAGLLYKLYIRPKIPSSR